MFITFKNSGGLGSKCSFTVLLAALSSWGYSSCIAALAFFSRIFATIFRAFDFTFCLLCFLRAGPSSASPGHPPHGHLVVAILLLLLTNTCSVATVSLTVFFWRVVERHTCCYPNILDMHKVVIFNGRSSEPCWPDKAIINFEFMTYWMESECLLVQPTWKLTERWLYFC